MSNNVDVYFKKQMEDLEFKAEYKLLEMASEIAGQIKKCRESKHLTQAQLANLLKTRQSRVSQMEDPLYATYTLLSLVKVALVLDCDLQVALNPAEKHTQKDLVVISETPTDLRFRFPAGPAYAGQPTYHDFLLCDTDSTTQLPFLVTTEPRALRQSQETMQV
jgi:predicted XRE-type DNA-binding protein